MLSGHTSIMLAVNTEKDISTHYLCTEGKSVIHGRMNEIDDVGK